MSLSRRNLASLVDDFARHGSDIAIVSPSGLRKRRLTYGELNVWSRRFAGELIKRGIVKGDRVLVWGENGPEWVAAFFGCVLVGVVPVPIDSTSSLEFVRRVSYEVSPRLVVGDGDKLDRLNLTAPLLPFAGFEEISAELATALDDLTESDTLQIVFTSGTTGEPKGVVHTHKNVLASLLPIEREMGKYLKYERAFHPIRFLHTLPLSHVFGQFMGLWVPPLLAAEVHYEPRLVASEIIDRIKSERISVLACVPRVLDLLRTYLSEQIPDLTTRVEGAARLAAWKRWWRFRDVHRRFGLKFWSFVCGGASLPSTSEQFWQA